MFNAVCQVDKNKKFYFAIDKIPFWIYNKSNSGEEMKLVAKTFERNIDNKYFKNFTISFDDGILKQHNQGVYKKIIKGFSQGKKVLFEQATGTGKSYLAIKFLIDHAQGKRVLFVSPANVIDGYFIDTLLKTLLNYTDEKLDSLTKQRKLKIIKQELNIDFETSLYQGLKTKAENQYDIIIFDEAHRMGAPTWGKSVESLMQNNPDAACLGMSATLERNDGVDVKKYFNYREPVSRYSLADALIDGILPNPNYTLAKVDFGDDEKFIDSSIADFNEKLKNATGDERKEILLFLDQLKKAKRTIADSDDIPTIIKKKFDKPGLLTGKYIIFCPAGKYEEEDGESIHRMKSIMQQAEDWFKKVAGVKKIKKYSVYSKLGNKLNHKIIKAFEKDHSKSLKLLYAINMLNEGLHVDGIDGIIMVRGTSSRIIYLEQLGRVLSVGQKQKPLVLDLVANLNYVEMDEVQSLAKKVNKGKAKGGGGDGTSGVDTNDVIEFTLDMENYNEIEFINALRKNIFSYNQEHNWFEEFYKDLLNYKASHQNFEGLQSRDNPSLRRRVGMVRMAKKGKGDGTILTEEMIARLDAIGFPWEAEKNDWFEEFYKDLLNYKQHHPDFKDISSRNSPLRRRVGMVRMAKKGKGDGTILTEEMIARLDAIGFPWEAEKNDWFEEFYKDLLNYKQHHLDFKDMTSRNSPLRRRVRMVRMAKKGKGDGTILTEEMIARLDAIGFPWEVENNWFEKFYQNLLIWRQTDPTFKNIRTFNSPQCPFGSSVNMVRQAKKGKGDGTILTEEMIARLDAIGFPWEGRQKNAEASIVNSDETKV